MARRHHLDPLPAPGPSRLPDEVSHHLATVLRARPGTAIVLFDGRGGEADATVTAVDRRAVTADVGPARQVDRRAGRHVELAFAVPKGARGEWIFEHGTEAGIAAFRPVRFERSNPERGSRVDRWRRITEAAAGQCGATHLPSVHEPVAVAALAAEPGLPIARVLLDPDATEPLGPGGAGDIVLLVGPEGGPTPTEVEFLTRAGFVGRNLGALVLRTETAALVATVRALSG
jgi:16S rRNA (uracil1498-N3)-methyltransferase